MATRRLTQWQVRELAALATTLGVSTDNAAAIESQVMGGTKEHILMRREEQHKVALKWYRQAVASVWKGQGLAPSAVDYLIGQARILNLSIEDAAGVERYVMGNTKELLVSPTPRRRSKVGPIILIVIGLLLCVPGLQKGGVGFFVMGLAIMILGVVLFFRKPKAKTEVPPPLIRNEQRET